MDNKKVLLVLVTWVLLSTLTVNLVKADFFHDWVMGKISKGVSGDEDRYQNLNYAVSGEAGSELRDNSNEGVSHGSNKGDEAKEDVEIGASTTAGPVSVSNMANDAQNKPSPAPAPVPANDDDQMLEGAKKTVSEARDEANDFYDEAKTKAKTLF